MKIPAYTKIVAWTRFVRISRAAAAVECEDEICRHAEEYWGRNHAEFRAALASSDKARVELTSATSESLDEIATRLGVSTSGSNGLEDRP